MKSLPLIAAATLSTAAMLVASAPAQAALPAVQIVKVYYDSPGSDRGDNTSLNGEWVQLKNTTRKAIQLEKWILRDETGYKYRFPRFSLGAGKTVTVRSGSRTDTSKTLYWGRSWYVWNNTGDTAGIYRGSDLKKIDTCGWKNSRTYTNCG